MKFKSVRSFISSNLKVLFLSIAIGLFTCAISIFAFSSPGSNQPPSGNPIFWLLSGTSMYYTGGNVGIGTASPVGTLDVNGNLYANNFTGMISFFVGPTCPTGWVLANGATVSSLGESAKLYTYIGTTYGVAGQLPDMTTAGRFIRSTGGNAATLGTQQADVFKSHIHSIVTESIGPDHEGPIFRTGNPYPGSGASSNSNAVTNATGSIETRPINYAMTPCVKY